MAAEQELGDLCSTLDSVLSEFFATLQELEDLRRNYDAVARDGYFCLTKARYAMGVQAVSQLQYDSNMQALVHVHEQDHIPSEQVHTSSEQDNASSEQEDGSATLRSFHAEHVHSSEARPKGGPKGSASEEGGTVLRQRKHPGVEDVVRSGKPVEKEEEEKAEEGGDRGSVKDPLTWFGILVPEHLRKCQQDFIKGTSLACDMASVQVRLLHLKQQYRRLLAQKKQLCEDRDRGTASKTEQSQ